jgi:hypothetical protein
LSVADGKRTILSFIYLLLFKERTRVEGEKLQTPGTLESVRGERETAVSADSARNRER